MQHKRSDRRDKILDDVAQLAGGAVSILTGIGRQMQGEAKSRVNDIAYELDLVPREDFDRLELLLSKALEKQEALEARIKKLEGKKSAPAKKTATKKKATKTKTAKKK